MPKPPKISSLWPIFAILFAVLVFFYPVWFQGRIPLPLDALVGVHVPWTEVKWEGYPTGVPIKNLEITDSTSQFYPWRSLVGEFWRAGEVPLWNPYMFSGTPFLATLHSAALYPLNLLYVFFPDHIAWIALLVSQIFLAALFMYLFLTNIGLRKEASFLGAIAFSLSGYMIAWLEFASGGQAGLWLPLLLLLEYKMVNSGKAFWFLPISLIFFFTYTAGDFQVPLYISITYILFGAFLAIQRRASVYMLQKNFFLIFAGIGFGILLSLPQLLPSLELFRQSIRVDDSYIRGYFFGLMNWEKVVNFIWPDFFGNVTTGNYWGKFGFHEYLSFTGIVTLVFAVYGLITKKMAMERFFWLLFIISLLFLFPTFIGFLPYKLQLPGLGTSSASRIIYLVDFCLVILGAYGFSKWQGERKSTIFKILLFFLIVTSGVALGVASSIYLIEILSGTSSLQVIVNLKVSLRNMIPSTLVLLFLGTLFFVQYKIIPKFRIKMLSWYFLRLLPLIVLFVAAAELLRFAWKNTSFSPAEFLYPKTQTLDFLQKQPLPFRIAGGIPTNLFMPYKIKSVEGYDPIYPMRYAEFLSAVNFGNLGSPSRRYGLIHSFSSPLLNYANVEYVVDYKKGPIGDINYEGIFNPSIKPPRYQPVFSEGRVTVFKNTKSFPQVWLSTNYKVISEPSKIIEELGSSAAFEDGVIVIGDEPKISIKGGNLDYTIRDFNESYNKLKLWVATSANSLLFLSESFFPGWRAFVDGQEVKILRANFAFQSIEIPKGDHEVEFIYEPQSFKIGAKISLATLAFLVVVLLYERFKTRSRKIT